MSKLEKIRRAILKYPKATTKEIAKRCDATTQDVYSARYHMKKENKANGYAPLEIKEGVEVGGLTLTKGKDSTYKWMRNDLLKKGKNDRFHNAVVGAVVAGMEQATGVFDTTPAIITTQPDMVNHPPHYTVGGLEVIDFIEAKQLSYHLGNVVKYVVRAGHKGDPLQDLQKARWYLERAIQKAE